MTCVRSSVPLFPLMPAECPALAVTSFLCAMGNITFKLGTVMEQPPLLCDTAEDGNGDRDVPGDGTHQLPCWAWPCSLPSPGGFARDERGLRVSGSPTAT